MQKLSGWNVKRLMRLNKITISALANRMNITQKRVREVREHGVEGQCMCLDWHEAIKGVGLLSPVNQE